MVIGAYWNICFAGEEKGAWDADAEFKKNAVRIVNQVSFKPIDDVVDLLEPSINKQVYCKRRLPASENVCRWSQAAQILSELSAIGLPDALVFLSSESVRRE